MAAFTSLASQLSDSASTQASHASAASQASAAASSMVGGVNKSAQWARGMFKSVVGEAELRAGLIGNRPEAIPADGSQCQGCGMHFGGMRRRGLCASCSRYLCGACIGSPFAAATGIHCFCPVTCPQCRGHSASDGEFQACRAKLESGVSVTIGVTQQTAGFFSTSRERKKVPAWFSLNACMAEFCWTSLEQRNGRPLQEVHISAGKLVSVRNTGVALELSVVGQPEATSLEFGTSSERDEWCRYIEVAMEVLTPEDDRERLKAARASQRDIEMQDRRARNDERRKNLSTDLGMKYSAQAMLDR